MSLTTKKEKGLETHFKVQRVLDELDKIKQNQEKSELKKISNFLKNEKFLNTPQ